VPHVIWKTAPEEHDYPAADTDIPCRLAVAEGNTSMTDTAR